MKSVKRHNSEILQKQLKILQKWDGEYYYLIYVG